MMITRIDHGPNSPFTDAEIAEMNRLLAPTPKKEPPVLPRWLVLLAVTVLVTLSLTMWWM